MIFTKEQILKRFTKTEDKLFISKILDKAEKCITEKCFVGTDFVDPYQRGMIEKTFSGNKDINCTFFGGFTGAERVIVILHPNFMSFNEESNGSVFLKRLNVELRENHKMSHRDFLGSLMSLGIKREKIGDILISNNSCDIIILSEIADYIKYNLNRISNTKVSPEFKNLDEIEKPDTKTRDISTTVASLRIDCVSSAGFGLSRTKIVDIIKSERLYLNWEIPNGTTRQVKEGDIISIRGKGRVIVEKIGGKTKKDRIGILIKRFI